LLVEEALCKPVNNLDIGTDTEENHSNVENIDNTVGKQVFAVEWWMQHYQCCCCWSWERILQVTWLSVCSLWLELALPFPTQVSRLL